MKTRKLFEKYGSSMIFERTTPPLRNEYKAFIQPLRYKNKLYLRGKYTLLGKNKEDYYLYIGPPEFDISLVDSINYHLYSDHKEYLVYRTERHEVSDECVYIWAIIRPVIQEDDDYIDEGGGEAFG